MLISTFSRENPPLPGFLGSPAGLGFKVDGPGADASAGRGSSPLASESSSCRLLNESRWCLLELPSWPSSEDGRKRTSLSGSNSIHGVRRGKGGGGASLNSIRGVTSGQCCRRWIIQFAIIYCADPMYNLLVGIRLIYNCVSAQWPPSIPKRKRRYKGLDEVQPSQMKWDKAPLETYVQNVNFGVRWLMF